MKLGIAFLLMLSLFSQANAQWKPWQIQTPKESHAVLSDGSSVSFPFVNLPIGVNYHVNAAGRITVSSNPNEFADARYYVNVLTFSPTVVPVSLKMRYSAAAEDWFNSAIAPSQQAGYQSSHIYDAPVTNSGTPLSFRFFDSKDLAIDPSRYADNSGQIDIVVSQETPRVAVQFDTLYFNNVRVGSSLRLLDSIQGYGYLGYRVDNVTLDGPSASKFRVSSQNFVPFALREATNEFDFIYTPTAKVRDTAFFHIYSTNAYAPEQEKIIVLIGQGTGAQLSVKPDTLDFGHVLVNSSTQLVATVSNSGNTDAIITSIAIAPSGSPFTVSPATATVSATGSVSLRVTFNPQASIAYLSKFTCTIDDGSTVVFYAKGSAGIGIPKLSDSVLDFGIVILNHTEPRNATLSNIGSDDINIVSTFNSNPTEYSLIGGQGAFAISGGSSNGYVFYFKPTTHLPGWQNHNGSFTFNFSDGTSKTILFKAADHKPLDVNVFLDTFTTTNPGKTVDVRLRLLDPLDSTLTPIRSFSNRISYDASLVDFVGARKGDILSSPDWKLTTTPGAGFINLSLNCTTERFGQKGTIVFLTFKAHDNAIPGDYTNLIQSNTNFPYPDEPTAFTNQGKLLITDICTPVHLSSGVAPILNSIEQNTPNPSTTKTTIHFGICDNGSGLPQLVKIALFDQLGRFITYLVNEEKTPGYYQAEVTASQLPSGLYYYGFETAGNSERRTMIISR